MSVRDHLDEARQIAALCLTSEEVALTIAAWMDSAAQHLRNETFYRELIIRCGNVLGPEAKTSDDGSVQQDVLALKVPEIVEKKAYVDADGFACFVEHSGSCSFCCGKRKIKLFPVGRPQYQIDCPVCHGSNQMLFSPGKPPVQPESAGTPPPAGV